MKQLRPCSIGRPEGLAIRIESDSGKAIIGKSVIDSNDVPVGVQTLNIVMVCGEHTAVRQNPHAESAAIGAIGKWKIVQVRQLCAAADVVTLNMLAVGRVIHGAPIRCEIHPPCTEVICVDRERLQQVSGGVELQNPAEARSFGTYTFPAASTRTPRGWQLYALPKVPANVPSGR